MMKTLVWGFCGVPGKAVVDALRSNLDIVEWVSDQPGSTSIWTFIAGTIPPASADPDAVRQFPEFFGQFFPVYQVMAARRGSYYADLHRVTHEFALNYYYFYQLLKHRQVELVIYPVLPHEGSDFVLYQVARMFGIKTLMCYQSIFASRFFMVTRLEDFGRFDTVPANPGHQPIKVEQSHHQALFYMQDVERRQALAETSPSLAARIGELWGQGRVWQRQFMRTASGAGLLNLSHFARSWLERKRRLAFETSLMGAEADRQTIRQLLQGDRKIAYFPLHLQPELTTSAIGGIFQDQLYALECLRGLLGEEWVIIVKENPKQTAFQRDDLFFRRLQAIPGVYLADRLFPSVEIIARSALTATISGTAGWEAVKGGSKCLVFGQAWYAGLSACLDFSLGLRPQDVQDFLDKPIAFTDILGEFDMKMTKAGQGVVDDAYAVLVDNFDETGNAGIVKESLLQVIRHPETQW